MEQICCLMQKCLTIVSKSNMCTLLLSPHVGPHPPNMTAWRWSIMVRVKPLQGGGLVPVTVGEDHTPERGGGTRLEQQWIPDH